MVNYCQALCTTDQGLNWFESEVMCGRPGRECESFIVKGVRTTVWSASLGRNLVIYLTRLRKLQTSVVEQGFGHFMILSHFEDCGSIPCAEIWWPRKSSSVTKNWHFLAFRCKCECQRACMIKLTCSQCSSRLSDQMTMSSMYTWQKRPTYLHRAAVIQRWWIGGAFFSPIGIMSHSYSPKGVLMAVKGTLSGWTSVWKKELVMLSFDQTPYHNPQGYRRCEAKDVHPRWCSSSGYGSR